MSILYRALKKAERERNAAGRTATTGMTGGASAPVEWLVRPRAISALAPTEVAVGNSRAATPMYRGIWISMALAVIGAAGVGYWMRGTSSPVPESVPREIVRIPESSSLTAPTPLPSALQMHEAGPLQLQLDRGVETLGSRARQFHQSQRTE